MQITRPLLAAKTTDADLARLKYPLLLSPKIDGVRALVVNGQLMSRSMKPIPNKHTQSLFGRSELNGLDGELVVGVPYDHNLMQQTTSGVMSHGGTPNVQYHVFDRWDLDAPFHVRLKEAESLATRSSQAYHVSHTLVRNVDELLELEQAYTEIGYEGVMLRSLTGRYKQNRSTLREGILLKVKRFHDSEAIVLGWEPLMRNLNEQVLDERGYAKRSTEQAGKVPDTLVGSLTVRDCVTGIVFSIGSGFTEAQRISLYHNRENIIGRLVKYKSFSVGVKDKPRFPIFLGFRSPLDI